MAEYKTYTVHARKKFPAWNESDGWDFVLEARTKAEATKEARKLMSDYGHTMDGPVYYTATETPDALLDNEDLFSDDEW